MKLSIATLFQQALETPALERGRFLAEACAASGELRQEIEELLSAHERAGVRSRWGTPGIEGETCGAGEPEARLENLSGRYKLQEQIGAGGMGRVFKATRKDEQFSQVVAIKLVQNGQPKLLERFRQERQILARLEHPFIARLLDVGTSDEGLPYLAMEFVQGQPLDEYLRPRRPSEREILEMFLKICDAVAYAHRNLVVHRDLKPANILVTPDGDPKLLDFGIAKLLESESGLTHTAAMTPEYASPEQVKGAAITTATDVYSLGVVL